MAVERPGVVVHARRDSTTMSFRVMWTFTTSPAGTAASSRRMPVRLGELFGIRRGLAGRALERRRLVRRRSVRRVVVGDRRDAAAGNLVARFVRCLRRDDGGDDECADRECEQQHDNRGERADALSAVAPTMGPGRAGRRVCAHLILLETM